MHYFGVRCYGGVVCFLDGMYYPSLMRFAMMPWCFLVHLVLVPRAPGKSFFDTSHKKNGQNGKVTGGGSLKPSDLKMGNENEETCFLLNRRTITALRLVFHSDNSSCDVYAIPIPGHPR